MTTPFLEANAILAMQEGDLAEVRRIVAELLPGERRMLAQAAASLAELCTPETCDIMLRCSTRSADPLSLGLLAAPGAS